jgi:hypothetical protein
VRAVPEVRLMPNDNWSGRGDFWEHDPGPPLNRRWLWLFAETPNYRGLGKAVLGREKFLWRFSPIHRGLLGRRDVEQPGRLTSASTRMPPEHPCHDSAGSLAKLGGCPK